MRRPTCQKNSLNIIKAKELAINCGRKQMRNYSPLVINTGTVKRMSSFKYFGVHFTEYLQTTHINSFYLSSFHLYHLQWLTSSRAFIRCRGHSTMESLLTGSITSWFILEDCREGHQDFSALYHKHLHTMLQDQDREKKFQKQCPKTSQWSHQGSSIIFYYDLLLLCVSCMSFAISVFVSLAGCCAERWGTEDKP